MRKASPTELEENLSAPKDIVVDQSTATRLEELCSQMTDTCGLIEATLQLAVEDKNDRQVAYIKTALYLSARGTKAIKMFLSEWRVLVQESKIRENRLSANDSTVGAPELARILNSVMAYCRTVIDGPTHLAEMEGRAVMNALRETEGDKGAASRLLRIGSRTTLWRKLKEYDQSS